MANPTATVTDFCTVLTKSRLLPPADVVTLRDRWAAEPPASDADVDSFRKFLVGKKYLTDYQAALVQRGHADGFYVGGYVILDKIGKGRSAGVYRAVHASGQVVALKVLPLSQAKNPQVLARFKREGRLLTQLDHPNVVRAYQVGSADGRNYIVMEHLEGETLDEVLARRKQIPPAEAARLAAQTLQGLQHLHERRMVHRDVKPANLMVTPAPAPGLPDNTLESTVKILDIGLGRELFEEGTSGTQDLQLTSEGTVLGTPDYLAPEQARDARSADIRADVYAVGCVLYHLLAGRPPFAEKNVMSAMVRHATEPVPPVTRFAPAVPPGVAAALETMLAKDPAGRFQTPGEAADALAPFVPPDASGASKSSVLPAFEQWLAEESPEAAADPDEPPTMTLPGARLPAPAAQDARRSAPIPVAKRSGPVPVPVPAAPPPEAAPSRTTGLATPVLPPEVGVELVSLPAPAAPPARPLYDLDRRDFIMLSAGAGGVITAILAGFLAARAVRTRDPKE
jgi:serine/threonine protein kinase